MAARQELHSGLSEMATQTQNYKLHKFELKDSPADITAINASMDIIDTQLKSLADGKFDKTGGTISGNLVVNGSTTLKKLTASELDLNGNADVSGTLKVTGAATLTGKLTANGGVTTKALTATSLDLNGNGDASGSLTVHGDLNAQGGLNVTDITATGSTTLVNLNAANITATGTLKVNGATTLTGALAANGGVTTKKVTATELDLNGNGDVSGNLNVGGLLQVTGQATHGNRITFTTNQWLLGSRSDVSVADTERDSATNIIVYRIADKNGAALISEEAYFNQDGSRDLRFNGRNRANTSWRLFLTIKEYANEEVRIIAADSPSASVNDHTLITAKWANEAFVHKSGDETIGGVKTFTGTPYVLGTTGYSLKHTGRDLKIVPEETQQSWVLQYKDKNNLNGLLLKHYQYASGETAVVLSDLNYYGSEDGDWASLSIGHYSDGTRYVKAQYDPLDGVIGYEVVTAKWLRSFIADAERSQLVHTVNEETITGKKTFKQSLYIDANPMIRRENWENVGIADTSRTESKQAIFAQITDKDGKRYMALEVAASEDGSRSLFINGRNRSDTGWAQFLQIKEDNTGYVSAILRGSPVTESNDNSIATTAWVTQKVNSNKLTIGNPVSQGASTSGSCTKNTIVYINSSGSLSDVKINGTTVATTSGYHAEQAQQVTLFVPAGGTWSVGHTGNGSVTSVLYQEIN